MAEQTEIKNTVNNVNTVNIITAINMLFNTKFGNNENENKLFINDNFDKGYIILKNKELIIFRVINNIIFEWIKIKNINKNTMIDVNLLYESFNIIIKHKHKNVKNNDVFIIKSNEKTKFINYDGYIKKLYKINDIFDNTIVKNNMIHIKPELRYEYIFYK